MVKDEGRADASLRSWMGKPLPLEQALAFTLQIARGMQHAVHKLPGFVHRDLKPENLLVGSDKLPGTKINRLRVTDFGLATLLEESDNIKDEEDPESLGRTHLTRGIVGTPLYMAPEQWTGSKVGVCTDVYALGCILYELLTGKSAADGKTIRELQAAHCGGNLRPIPGDLPSGAQAFLRRSLSLSVGGRYEGWDEVINALQTLDINLPSLTQMTEKWKERHDRGSSYLAMGSSYLHMGKADVAIPYFEKALNIAREMGNQKGECTTLGNLGGAYISLGNSQRAIEYYKNQLKIAHQLDDQEGEFAALGSLGTAYDNLGDIKRAIGYYEQCLAIVQMIEHQAGQGFALSNLGSAYHHLGDIQRAIKFYEQALAMEREIGDRRGEGMLLANLGSINDDLGNAQRAIEYFEESVKIAREIGNRSGEGYTFRCIGIAYQHLGNIRSAIQCYEESLRIAREISDYRLEGAVLGELGAAYGRLGDIPRAIEYCKYAIVIRREIGDIDGVALDSYNMANVYGYLGEIAQAIPLIQEAVQIWTQMGNPRAQQAQQLLSQLQGGVPVSNASQADAAFEAFLSANNFQEMEIVAKQYPFINDIEYLQAMEHFIEEQVPFEQKSHFEQRLVWLRKIVGKKPSGFLDHLFGKKG